MIVMKNNDFKSSKRILPSKKMLCTASLLISKEIEKYIQKKENQLVDKLQQAGFLSTKLTVRQADKLEEELTNILQSHNEEFISLLKKYQEQGKTLEDVLNALPNFNQSRATAIKSAINTAVYNNLTEMIPKVANRYLKNIDGELEIKQMTKTTVNWIKNWSKNLADIMNINTEEMLRNTLVNGINGGIGIDEISRNMIDNGTLKTRVRARTTAVTEVLTANRIAAQEAIIQAPETNRKQWKHSGSYKIKPRENHIKMNGQVVLKTQPFKMIGADGKTYYPMIPGDTSLPPAERINCHCIVSPVLDDSVFNMTLEERQALQQKCIQEYDEFNGLNTENSLDNSQESGIMEEREMFRRKSRIRNNIKIISDKQFNDLTIEARKNGAIIKRGGEDVENHLDNMGANASILSDILFFRENVTVSEVLEETYHFMQDKNGLNSDKPGKLRIILNEIDAKKYLIKNEKKYGIPRSETEETLEHLKWYTNKLEEYKRKKGR